jgi:hypothetical protein
MPENDRKSTVVDDFADEPTLRIPKETMRDLLKQVRRICELYDDCPNSGLCLERCLHLKVVRNDKPAKDG